MIPARDHLRRDNPRKPRTRGDDPLTYDIFVTQEM